MIGSRYGRTTGEVVRFVLIGGLNTVLTGTLFIVLSSIMPPTISYTVAFAAGILFSVLVTPRLVFRARASAAQRVRYAGWYLFVYVIGLGIVYLLADRLSVQPTTIAVVTFLATAGLSFLGARFLFTGDRWEDAHDI